MSLVCVTQVWKQTEFKRNSVEIASSAVETMKRIYESFI